MKRIAVVGSGTDVGKTFVTCRLLEDLRARGVDVVPRKPVVSGIDPAAMATSDTDRLIVAAGIVVDDANRDRVSPFRFIAPLAPNEAARREGVVLDHAAIVNACAVDGDPDAVVVETAGGVMSPLTDTTTQLDLVVDLGAVALLVVEGSYLGWISHTLTAVFALQTRGVDVVGIVVNHGVTLPLHPFV
ncbi:MAG TPA: dethiobiotin synthase, partial [Myxococcota bacterium]